MNVKPKLIEKLKQKDEDAFNIIYDKYVQLVYYILRLYVKDKDDCEELVQDVFTIMYNKIEYLKRNESFKNWLIKIAKNVALGYLYKKKEFKSYLEAVKYDMEISSCFDSDITEYFPLNIKDVERSIVVLKLIYKMTFKEIAKETNLSIDVVTKSYYSAINKIKKEYKKFRS